ERRGFGGQRRRLSELFGSERTVEAHLRRDAAEQLTAGREQRLAFLRIARQRLQAARLPVDPGGVLLLGRRHGVDRLDDLLPARTAVVGPQRSAHLPRE